MITASKISNIFKEAVNNSSKVVTSYSDRSSKIKDNVVKEIREKLKYSDIILSRDVTKISDDIDINIVIEGALAVDALRILAQMTYHQLSKTLTIVYSDANDGRVLYTFGDDIYTVCGYSIDTVSVNDKTTNVVAVAGNTDKNLLDYINRFCSDANIMNDSIGSTLMSLILGKCDSACCCQFDESKYAELLKICNMCGVERICFNGIYKFSRKLTKTTTDETETEFIHVIGEKSYKCIRLCGDKYAVLNNPKSYKDYGPVYPIIALKSFADIKVGTVGGYISLDTTIDLVDRSWVDEGSIVIKSNISKNSSIEGPKVVILNSDISYCGLNNKTAKFPIFIKDSNLSDCDIVGKFMITSSNLKRVTRTDDDDESTDIVRSVLTTVNIEPAIVKLNNVCLDNVVIEDDTSISNVKIIGKSSTKLACSSMKVIDLDTMITINNTGGKVTKKDIDTAIDNALSNRKTDKIADSAMNIIKQNSYFNN